MGCRQEACGAPQSEARPTLSGPEHVAAPIVRRAVVAAHPARSRATGPRPGAGEIRPAGPLARHRCTRCTLAEARLCKRFQRRGRDHGSDATAAPRRDDLLGRRARGCLHRVGLAGPAGLHRRLRPDPGQGARRRGAAELRAAGRRAQPRRPPARGARPGPSRAHRSLLLRAADGLRVPGGRARAERGPHARRRQGRPHPGGAAARGPRRRPGDAGLRGDPRVRRPGAAGLQAAAAHRGRPPRGGRGDQRGEHRERPRPDAAPARPRPPPAALRRRPRLRPGHPRPLPRLRAGPREPARSRRGRAGAHPVPRGRRHPARGAHPRRRRRRRRARVRQRRARPVGHGAAAGGRQGRPRRHRRRRLGRRDDRPLRPPRPHHRPPARARARRDGRGPAARAGHRRLPRDGLQVLSTELVLRASCGCPPVATASPTGPSTCDPHTV